VTHVLEFIMSATAWSTLYNPRYHGPKEQLVRKKWSLTAEAPGALVPALSGVDHLSWGYHP